MGRAAGISPGDESGPGRDYPHSTPAKYKSEEVLVAAKPYMTIPYLLAWHALHSLAWCSRCNLLMHSAIAIFAIAPSQSGVKP